MRSSSGREDTERLPGDILGRPPQARHEKGGVDELREHDRVVDEADRRGVDQHEVCEQRDIPRSPAPWTARGAAAGQGHRRVGPRTRRPSSLLRRVGRMLTASTSTSSSGTSDRPVRMEVSPPPRPNSAGRPGRGWRKSASTMITLLPRSVSARARPKVTVVLPSPAHAEVTSSDLGSGPCVENIREAARFA